MHLPWTCDCKRNHKTGTEQIESCRDILSTNYQEGCSIILRIQGLLQEIPNYATIVKPLMDLTQKRVPESIPWSVMCQEVFQILKQTLLTNPIVRNPDLGKVFIL